MTAYRPDIDGLRAIAVLAVAVYHADVALPGGYIGVDVFFVISGYLITRQVVVGAAGHRFSLWEFYLRRVRRLLPAALCTVALTVLFAVAFLPPFRVAEIASSATAAALSVSNIFFWLSSGYWAPESENQPLLHTWSLGVEEQFYLVWPLLVLALVATRLRRLALPVLVVGTLASLAVTTWATDHDASAAFYLTPFRAYEFAFGALCVWIERIGWGDGRGWRIVRTGTWLLGLALVLVPVLTFASGSVDFPGALAAIPAAGTALLILARRPPVLDHALSNPVMRYFGVRSYSLYLVHWPVLVYARELTERVTPLITLGLFALIVVLAELLHRFVERPLRVRGPAEPRPKPERRRRFVRVAGPVLVGAVVLSLAGAGASAYAASPSAYSPEVRPVVELTLDEVNAERRAVADDICGDGDPLLCGEPAAGAQNVFVIGDSVGPDGLNIVSRVAPDARLLMSAQAGCPPLRDLAGAEVVFGECEELNERRFAELERLAPQLDVIVVAMQLLPDGEEALAETVEWLRSLGPEVAVLGLGAQYQDPPWQTVLRMDRVDGFEQALHDDLDVTAELNDSYKRAVTGAGGVYIDRWDEMCSADECLAYVGDDVGQLVMYDTAHLTGPGAIAIGDALADDPEIRRLFD